MATEKHIEGLRKLFEIVADEPLRASVIASRIPADKLDLSMLIGFQRSHDRDVRSLTRELALCIPADKLDLSTLIEFQRSTDVNVRSLTWALALCIPADKLDLSTLVRFQRSGDEDVRGLVQELFALRNSPDKLAAVDEEFLSEYFSG